MTQRPKKQPEVLGKATQQCAQSSLEPSMQLQGRTEKNWEIKGNGSYSPSAPKSLKEETILF